ncbi:SDR family oxidoreductase [Brotaphodocola sp.]|uniref:SDR family oxidoreductase n=1 Tax=Brotaphodocola sp. TaxID=3073577 RepID=UPI003D7E13AC
MGVYAVTGGSSGIGAKTVALLKKKGHEVVNIDLKKGDIEANLALPEGRQTAIDELYERYPEGIDGLVCNAGVSGACGNLRLIVSLNFFGTISLIKGVYDLLKKKGGNCVVLSSNTISQGALRMDLADLLNNNNEDEQRILNLVDGMDETSLSVGNSVYVATKYALARWVRRHSASYAANGVRINAVAPGNVNTAMTATMSINAKMALNALPIPTKYGKETLMDPEEIASAIVFLGSEEARGINGIILFVDGGTDALLNTEKVY